MDEKSLLEAYIEHKKKVEETDLKLKDAKEWLRIAENALIAYLEDRGQTKSGTYDGLGGVTIRSTNKYSVEEEKQWLLFEYLKQHNLDGVIKQSIHHKTLDRICSELVESGEALPEFIRSFNITTLQLQKG